jgi:hypothetical protein
MDKLAVLVKLRIAPVQHGLFFFHIKAEGACRIARQG